jgi:diacylglycerol kinase (ATP)
MNKHQSFRRFLKSFNFAFHGVRLSFKKGEVNIKIHIVISFATIITSFLLNISALEWIAIIGCMGIVIAAELFNTAIEKVVDIISPEWNPKAGAVKDIAAGAVLILSCMAALIGVLIFLPKIIALIR